MSLFQKFALNPKRKNLVSMVHLSSFPSRILPHDALQVNCVTPNMIRAVKVDVFFFPFFLHSEGGS